MLTGDVTLPATARTPLGAALSKWQRDTDVPLRARLDSARAYAAALAQARLHLRRVTDLGSGARTYGRPRITNQGTMTLGPGCVLRSTPVSVELSAGPGAELVLGANVVVNSGASIAAVQRISLGARVLVGPYVIINDSSYHELYDRSATPLPNPVVIEDDVWIGAKATIAPGVHIGRGAVVVGHALVTRNVKPFTIVSGVPAEQIGVLDPRKFIVRNEP